MMMMMMMKTINFGYHLGRHLYIDWPVSSTFRKLCFLKKVCPIFLSPSCWLTKSLNPTTVCVLVGGLVAIFYFPSHIGCLIIPIDELIFFRGVFQPPTRCFTINSPSTMPPFRWLPLQCRFRTPTSCCIRSISSRKTSVSRQPSARGPRRGISWPSKQWIGAMGKSTGKPIFILNLLLIFKEFSELYFIFDCFTGFFWQERPMCTGKITSRLPVKSFPTKTNPLRPNKSHQHPSVNPSNPRKIIEIPKLRANAIRCIKYIYIYLYI